MKVAVINPPSPFLINQKVFPNMGIVRVATALSKQHDVTFFDFAGNNHGKRAMRRIAHEFDAYLFGSTTPNFPYAYELFRTLKSTNPEARTIIGGPHASAMSSLRRKGIQDKNIFALEEFDTVFEGEGEDITKLFTPGWVKGDLIRDIDSVPIPDYDFLDLPSYRYFLLGKPTVNIQTQRGCPHQCSFCSGRDVEMYNRVRAHSPQRVIQEMDALNKKYGYESFMWYDDEINLNPKRLEELCHALIRRNYQHRGFIRSDMVTRFPKLVPLMKKAGFVKLCAGVESGSDRILKVINKGTTHDMNLEARQIIQDVDIHYEAFCLLGHPSETEEDVEMTKQWIKEANPDDFDINIITPYPGSKIYDDAIRSKKFPKYHWEYKGLYFNKPLYSRDNSYYKGIGGLSCVDTRTDAITSTRLHGLREEIECLKQKKDGI